MKIKSNYVIKTIGEEIVVVPVKDEAVRFNGIITLNKTGKFLFQSLQENSLTKNELLALVLDKYDVEEEVASKDLEAFIEVCKENDLLE